MIHYALHKDTSRYRGVGLRWKQQTTSNTPVPQSRMRVPEETCSPECSNNDSSCQTKHHLERREHQNKTQNKTNACPGHNSISLNACETAVTLRAELNRRIQSLGIGLEASERSLAKTESDSDSEALYLAHWPYKINTYRCRPIHK